jgi:hypothetical protein
MEDSEENSFETLKRKYSQIKDENNQIKDENNQIKDENNQLKDKSNQLEDKNKELVEIVTGFIEILDEGPPAKKRKKNNDETFKKRNSKEKKETKDSLHEENDNFQAFRTETKENTTACKTKRKHVKTERFVERKFEKVETKRRDCRVQAYKPKEAAAKLWKALNSIPVDVAQITRLIQEMKRSSSYAFLNQPILTAYAAAKKKFYSTSPLDHVIYLEDANRLVKLFHKEDVLDKMELIFYKSEEHQEKEEYKKYLAYKKGLVESDRKELEKAQRKVEQQKLLVEKEEDKKKKAERYSEMIDEKITVCVCDAEFPTKEFRSSHGDYCDKFKQWQRKEDRRQARKLQAQEDNKNKNYY